jgi:hypothetical protein
MTGDESRLSFALCGGSALRFAIAAFVLFDLLFVLLYAANLLLGSTLYFLAETFV